MLRYVKIALAALFLVPGTALADNECGLQVGTTPVDCDQASYPGGVTYDAVGDLFIDFTASPTAEIESGGIDLSATGGDSIVFDSQTTATEIESRAVTGPLLDVQTASGDIDVATEEMDADGQSPQNVTHAIRAVSGSGGISISTSGNVDAASGLNPADSIGIEAATGGSGTLTITASGAVAGNEVAIDASTGTGLLTIDVAPGSGTVDAIRTDAGGDAVIDIASGRVVSSGFTTANDREALDLNAVGEITVNNSGAIRKNSGLVIRAAGGALTLNNDNEIRGAIGLSGLGDGYTFNNDAGAVWRADTQGNLVSELGAGELNNAGTIEFQEGTVVSAPGTTFSGIGASQLETRAILDGDGQADCASASVAGCLDLTGGSTAGQTSILIVVPGINDPFAETIDKPVNSGVVLVDVGGGTSQESHFVLDSGSTNYAPDPVYGNVITTGGLFDYTLLYNPENQQHLLASVPQHEALEYAAFIHEALSIWHTSSDAVAGRQADLRQGGERGGWIRAVTQRTKRDFTPTVTTHGNTFNYDRGYKLNTKALVAGYDMTADDNHVFGVHLGFMGATLDHDDSETSDKNEFPSSVTFGAYAGWWRDSGLTLDGTINVNLLDIEHDVRDGLEDTRTNVLSAGVRAEAGWRLPMGQFVYVQPLATVAYAHADIENLNMRDYDARFENTESARTAIGLRVGGDVDEQVAYWVSARAWEEYADDGNVQFLTDGDPLVIEDDMSGSFEELAFGVEISNEEGTLSGYFSGGATFGDDVDAYNLSVGARMRW